MFPAGSKPLPGKRITGRFAISSREFEARAEMNFLPIVVRELRLAARRKGTYRLRCITSLLAIVISVFFLFFFVVIQNTQAGRTLFDILSYLLFGLCVMSGVFLTADCLSEEK